MAVFRKNHTCGRDKSMKNCRRMQQDDSGKTPFLAVTGQLLRLLPAFCLVFGLYLFNDNAFGIGSSKPASALLTGGMLFLHGVLYRRKTRSGFGIWFVTVLLFFGLLYASGLPLFSAPLILAKGFFNTAVTHMMAVGYGTLKSFLLDIPYSIEEEIAFARLFLLLIMFLFTVLTACCTKEKIRILPLAVFVFFDYFVIFMYNICTSRWGFMLSAAGICGLLCMKMSASVRERMGAEEGTLSADEIQPQELSLPNPTRRSSASDGWSGAVCTLLALLAAWWPAQYMTRPFRTCVPLETMMETIRSYEMALLTGEEIQLSDIGLSGSAELIRARSSAAEPRSFTGKRVLEVQSNVSHPVYLRSWISTAYREDLWHVADEAEREVFDSLFPPGFRAEDITYRFFRNSDPELAAYDNEKTCRDHSSLGYMTSLISVRNTGVSGNLLFLPSCFDPWNSLLSYGTMKAPYEGRFVNDYDGIAYSRGFHRGSRYSAVAFLPVLENRNWVQNLNRQLYAYQNMIGYYPYLGDDFGVLFEDRTKKQLFPNTTAYYQSLDVYGQAAFVQEIGEIWEYHRYVTGKDSPYLTVTEDEMLNRKLRDFASAIISREPLPDTGIRTVREDSGEICDLTEILAERKLEQEHVMQTERPDYSPSVLVQTEVSAAGTDAVRRYYAVDPKRCFASFGDLYGFYAVEFADRIAAYLAENMTYTLTPALPERQEIQSSSVERFLFETKEGYCVQYATAAVLLLRSIGIPARYVEGYLAADFQRNRDEDDVGLYVCQVRDDQAHAWAEIYLPYYGWRTVEVTTPYYRAAHSSQEIHPKPSPEEPQKPVSQADPEEPHRTDAPVREEEARLSSAEITVLIVLLLLSVLAAVLFLLYRAGQRRKHRQLLFLALHGQIQTEQLKQSTQQLYDAMFSLVRHLGFRPAAGESLQAFLKRLHARFPAAEDLADAASALAEKNEFSEDSLSQEELRVFASYLLALEDSIRTKIGWFRRQLLTWMFGIL